MRLSREEQALRAEFIGVAVKRRVKPESICAVFGISRHKLVEIVGPGVIGPKCRLCGGPHEDTDCHARWVPTCSVCGVKGHNRRTCQGAGSASSPLCSPP